MEPDSGAEDQLLAGPGVARRPRTPAVDAERPEATDFNPLAGRQRVAQQVQETLHPGIHMGSGKIPEALG